MGGHARERDTSAFGKILTTDILRKRGLFVEDWCFGCKKDGESVDHLFLHCEVAKTLWDEAFGRTGIAWVMPKQVVDLLACLQGFKGSHRIGII